MTREAPQIDDPSLRVGYVLKRFPRLSETFILNEVLELERQGVHVEIFSLLKPPEEARHAMLSEVKARVTYLPGGSLVEKWSVREGHAEPSRRMLGSAISSSDPIFNGKSSKDITRLTMKAVTVALLAQSNRLDHLHAHFASDATTVALLAGRLAALPFTFTAHARDIYHTYIDRESDNAMRRAKIAEAAAVVTVSDYNQDHLVQLCGSQNAHHIHRLYNGIDLRRFVPSEATREPNVILSVGRMIEKKGFPDLLSACALLRDRCLEFRCLIVGDGPDRDALQSQAATLGLIDFVEFYGGMRQEELVSLMAKAGLIVLPCVVSESGDRDGLPTVLLEGLAAGLPVVTTSVSGGPEIVEDGTNGHIVPPNDPERFANAMTAIIGNTDLGRRMGNAGRAKAERLFDLSRNVATLRGVFETSRTGCYTEAAE